MLNCKNASDLASRSLDKKLPWPKRWALRMHIFMCHRCRRYLRQLRLIKQVAALLAQRLNEGNANIYLSAEAKVRIQNKLDENSANAP